LNNNQDKSEYRYVEVAVPVSQFQTFTYKIKNEYIESLGNKELIGRRVLVPFRTSGFSGIITEVLDKKPNIKNIREVEQLPDKEPVFSQQEINILKKISDYYISPIGLTIYYFLPEGLRWKKENGKWINKASQDMYIVPNVVSTTGIQKLSLRALELLEIILEKGEITKSEIKELGFSESPIKTLLKKNLIKIESYIYKEPTLKQPVKIYKEEIQFEKDFYLYHSEKIKKRIETYLSIIESSIKKGKSVLIVFPNIKEITTFYEKIKPIFGDKAFIYHDSISNKENLKTWFQLKKLKGTITVGTYKSLLIPIKNLEVVIIEEEHSESYKSLRTPRFDARHVAYNVYQEKDTTLIFSSSVPSVESYFALKRKLMKPLKEKSKNSKIKTIIFPFKSEKNLKTLLKDNLKEDKTILILANKKAYASFLFCKVCEQEIMCEKCDIPLKIYKKDNNKFLKCDICEKKYNLLKTCPHCESELEEIGFGIEKIEEFLKNEFSVSYLEENKNTKIKLATNIIDKELSIAEFEKIINIYPDFLLNIYDFRGNEKFFRNISYPLNIIKEKYILITNNTENIAVQSLLSQKFNNFYEKELENRKKFNYPPFSKLILLTFQKKNLELDDVEQLFKNWINKNNIKNINYSGAFYAYYSNIRGITRIQILLKDFKKKKALINLYEMASRKSIKLIIDVDPKNLY